MHSNPLLFIVWVLMAVIAVLSFLHDPSGIAVVNSLFPH